MQASVAVSFPFYPEHVPLQSAFLSDSDHTSIVFEEVESSNDVLSNSDSPSICDESIIELSLLQTSSIFRVFHRLYSNIRGGVAFILKVSI